MERPVVLIFGPRRDAISGVSTHLNLLFSSRLPDDFSLLHFEAGSEGRGENALARLVRILTSPWLVAATILMRRVAIVHLNTALTPRAYWRDLAYMIVARICGARVLYQVHGGALPQQFCARIRLFERFLRWTLELPDAIVVLARAEQEAFRQFVPRQQVLVFPNSIDYARYAMLEREWTEPAAPLRLLYIGRLARDKGLYEALEALQLARAQGVRAQWVVAGSGPEEARLTQTVRELGLTGDVTFVGPVFGEGKLRLLGRSDASLLASYSEGLPYALLESMAAGVPVIATRVGAIPDVVVDGVHGLLVARRDADAIARAIARLAADRAALLRMGAACRRRIARHYDMGRLAEEFRQLYGEICTGKRSKVLT